MARELSASELFPDDILWFLQDTEVPTMDEVDRLISQIEVNAQMSSTQPAAADSASAISGTSRDNFANVDSMELKRLHDLNFNKNTKRSTNTWVNRFESWRVSREVAWRLEGRGF